MDEEDKFGVLGCLGALAAIGAVVAVIVWFATLDSGPEAPEPVRRTPLTRIDPVRAKTVVDEAVPVDPLAKKVNTEETPPARQGRTGGVAAAVQNLGPFPGHPPSLPDTALAAADAVLSAEPLCYQGRLARRAPSLFDDRGFAITYGADDYNGGDPLPRLEIFFDDPASPAGASFLSLTKRDIPEFPGNREISVSANADVLHRLIARWIAAVATETCPDKAPDGPLAPSAGPPAAASPG